MPQCSKKKGLPQFSKPKATSPSHLPCLSNTLKPKAPQFNITQDREKAANLLQGEAGVGIPGTPARKELEKNDQSILKHFFVGTTSVLLLVTARKQIMFNKDVYVLMNMIIPCLYLTPMCYVRCSPCPHMTINVNASTYRNKYYKPIFSISVIFREESLWSITV